MLIIQLFTFATKRDLRPFNVPHGRSIIPAGKRLVWRNFRVQECIRVFDRGFTTNHFP